MPPSFWHHALSMATYLLNILPSKVLNYQSPAQILYQSDPDYSGLRVFGCLCFPLFSSSTIHKLQERSTLCAYLGPAPNHRGSKCYDMSSGKIIICRHVRFVETEFPFSQQHIPQPSNYDFLSDNINSQVLYYITQNTTPQNMQPDLNPQPNSSSLSHSGPRSHTGPDSASSPATHTRFATPLGQIQHRPNTPPSLLDGSTSGSPVHSSGPSSLPHSPTPSMRSTPLTIP